MACATNGRMPWNSVERIRQFVAERDERAQPKFRCLLHTFRFSSVFSLIYLYIYLSHTHTHRYTTKEQSDLFPPLQWNLVTHYSFTVYTVRTTCRRVSSSLLFLHFAHSVTISFQTVPHRRFEWDQNNWVYFVFVRVLVRLASFFAFLVRSFATWQFARCHTKNINTNGYF